MIAKTTQRPLSAPHGQLAGDVLAAHDVSSTIGLSEAQLGGCSSTDRTRSTCARRSARLPSWFISFKVSSSLCSRSPPDWHSISENGRKAAPSSFVLGLNTVIGFLTEIKAARSIEALRVLGMRSARVRRDGQTRLISAERLVPGDILLLEINGSPISGSCNTCSMNSMGSVLQRESAAGVSASGMPCLFDRGYFQPLALALLIQIGSQRSAQRRPTSRGRRRNPIVSYRRRSVLLKVENSAGSIASPASHLAPRSSIMAPARAA